MGGVASVAALNPLVYADVDQSRTIRCFVADRCLAG